VLGPDGLPRFDELRRRGAARTAILYAFDLIEHDGEDLRNLPFLDRKAALARLRNHPYRPSAKLAASRRSRPKKCCGLKNNEVIFCAAGVLSGRRSRISCGAMTATSWCSASPSRKMRRLSPSASVGSGCQRAADGDPKNKGGRP
jgi:hypothetical protein